jgi:hypothetical protein
MNADLLGKWSDLLLIGGASILTLAGFHLFVPMDARIGPASQTFFVLSWVVNWPHFMFSYQLLYWDQRRALFRKISYVWAGFVVPLLLVAILAWGFYWRHGRIFGHVVQLMFLTVGWHYVRQTFGTMVVVSARRRFFLAPPERRAVLASLYSLWALSFVGGSDGARADFYGLRYRSFHFPLAIRIAVVVVAAVALMVALGMLFARHRRGRGTMPWVAWISYMSIYIWFLPMISHPQFLLAVPLFHSLQYFLCVGGMKKSEWLRRRQGWSWPARAAGFYLVAVVLGAALFWLIPHQVDARMGEWAPWAAERWTPALFAAFFTLFINIHHYFVDAVLWRKDNPQARDNLFVPAPARESF